MRNLLIVFLVITISACAASRGFDRGNLRSQMTGQKMVTEEEIKKVLALKPQLSSPFKLAVYFSSGYGYSWNWLAEDKDRLLAIGSELKTRNIISDIVVLGDSLVDGKGNQAIRLAAARAGADAVLIVDGVSDVDRYNNVLGATYFLLVTPFFVPGTVDDGLFMITASLWDVRNQYLYLTTEVEGAASETRPAFFIEDHRVVKAAKTEALSALVKELSSRIDSMNPK